MKEKEASVKWYLAAIIVLGMAISFVYFRYIQLQSVQVNGLALYARAPADDLKKVLGGGKVILREELFAGNDERNTVVGALGAEIAGAFSRNNRVLAIYGHVEGVPNEQAWVNCISDTGNCTGERIVVKLDPCNCLKIDGGKMYVLFDEQAAKSVDTRIRLAGVVNGVLEAVDRGA